MKAWAEQFYNSDAWRACREGFLQSKGYLCERCSTPDNPVVAKIAHHKIYLTKENIPSESYQTKGDSIEFTTPEITGQFIKRPDGLWKAEHVALPTETAAQGWFTKVREQNNTSGG